VECGRGTYIRPLAHALGTALGCGGHLKSLVRLRSGQFRIEDSSSLEAVEVAFRSGQWRGLLQPMDVAVNHLERVTLDAAAETAVINGRFLEWTWGERPAGDMCRAYSLDGHLVAILAYDGNRDLWRPKKVLAPRPSQS